MRSISSTFPSSQITWKLSSLIAKLTVCNRYMIHTLIDLIPLTFNSRSRKAILTCSEVSCNKFFKLGNKDLSKGWQRRLSKTYFAPWKLNILDRYETTQHYQAWISIFNPDASSSAGPEPNIIQLFCWPCGKNTHYSILVIFMNYMRLLIIRKFVIGRKQMLHPFQAIYLKNSHSDSSWRDIIGRRFQLQSYHKTS